MIKVCDKYKPLYEEKTRYYIITGGRNSGKSFVVNLYGTQKTFDSGVKGLFTRYTMTSAEKSIIPEFNDKIDLLNANNYFDVTKKSILNKYTGSEIMFSGIKTSSGNQTANLKSLSGMNFWVLDEAEELTDEKTFDTIDLSIRDIKKKNIVVLVLNPTTKEHWIWKRWFESTHKYIEVDGVKVPVSTHPEVTHIHTTYLDNIENIPPDYLERIMRMKTENPKKYEHVIIGGWLNKAEGVIFENWSTGTFDESLPYGYGQDFGFAVDPDTLIKVAIDEKQKRIYVKEEIYQNGLSTDQLKSKVLSITGDNLVIADNAEPRLIRDLSNEGINIKPCLKGKDSVKAGIKKMMDYEIIVSPCSMNIIKELNNYVWSDKKSETPVDDYNHAIDAIRYYVFFTKNKIKSSIVL
jgi:phage terminase large subunit